MEVTQQQDLKTAEIELTKMFLHSVMSDYKPECDRDTSYTMCLVARGMVLYLKPDAYNIDKQQVNLSWKEGNSEWNRFGVIFGAPMVFVIFLPNGEYLKVPVVYTDIKYKSPNNDTIFFYRIIGEQKIEKNE